MMPRVVGCFAVKKSHFYQSAVSIWLFSGAPSWAQSPETLPGTEGMPQWVSVTVASLGVMLLALAVATLISRIEVLRKTSELRAKNEALQQAATEHEEQDRLLVEGRERLALALGGANLGLWDRDVPTGKTVVNERWAEMLGFSLDEIQPGFDTWKSMIHPEDVDNVIATLNEHLEGKTPGYEREYRMRTKSGGWRWILSRGKVVEWDPDGKPLRVSGTHLDIQERKESQERYETLFQTMLNGFALHEIICDDQGVPTDYRFLEINPTFERFTGLKAADVVGRTVKEVLPAIEDYWIETYGEVALTGKPTHFENYSLELDRYYECTAYCPLKGQFAVIFQDVTARKRADEERKKLQEELQNAQKLESLGVLAGGIAHDFNNLLMGVLGNADLAMDEVPRGSPAYGNLKEIELAGKRAADLCRQMLAYSGKGRFVIDLIDLNHAIREITHLIEVSISKNAVLNFNLAENLPRIEADATQIRQVVMNLITNASEAIEDVSGIIRVSTGARECDEEYLSDALVPENRTAGLYVYLEVSDTGGGMDVETAEKMFDPFFTTKFTGRGLGLAAVLGIVRGHSGVIKLGTEPGQGTTFTVLFPASNKEPAPSEEKEFFGGWHGAGTVLLVDDDETVRTVGKRMLERAGLAVLVASDGRMGLKMFGDRADDVDCVVLDLTMPHMGGEQAFHEMKKVRPDIPVILSSGYNEQAVTDRFVGSGLAGFIQKPYASAALLEKIAEVMGGAKLGDVKRET